MGQIKNIKLHIATDIKGFKKYKEEVGSHDINRDLNTHLPALPHSHCNVFERNRLLFLSKRKEQKNQHNAMRR